MRREVTFFVFYAHRNRALAENFLEKLTDMLAPSKKHADHPRQNSALILGERWEMQIAEAIDRCDFGLLLISPAFLASPFITEKELPAFVTGMKPSVPVMLQPVDFSLHDLKGLEKKQIFMLDHEGFKVPRAYAECGKQRRETFVLALFRAIEKKVAHCAGAPHSSTSTPSHRSVRTRS